jgi:hypothetical protein
VLNRARAGEPAGAEAEAEPEAESGDGDGDTPDGRRAAGWMALGVQRLPESRMGAQLALGGREARGELGRAIAGLADLCEGRS